MTRKKASKSIGKTGKIIDGFAWFLVIAQVALIYGKLADPALYPWWKAFIPAYILAIPLLLIAFGLTQASRK